MRQVRLSLTTLIVFHVILLFIPTFTTSYVTTLILSILRFVVLAESWTILSGYTGYLTLGTATFFGIGAYIVAVNPFGFPLWTSVILAAPVSFLIALAAGYPVLRVRGPYFTILTFGLALVVQNIFINWETLFSKTVGRLVIFPYQLSDLYYSMLGLSLIATLTNFIIRRSKLGIGLISIREDEDAAEAAGVDTTRYKMLAFAISSIFPGLAGALSIIQWSYIDPYSAFDPLVSFQTVIMALLGGASGPVGPLVGAVFLSALQELLWSSYPFHYLILLGAILIALVLFIPRGIVGIPSMIAARRSISRTNRSSH